MRATLLDHPELAKQVAPDLPQSSHQATLYILRTPGVSPFVRDGLARVSPMSRIDDFRDNWWCGSSASASLTPPAFLDASQVTAAAAERDKFGRSGWYVLGNRVLAWAKDSPNDPDLPEALALAVRATRFGACNGESTKEISGAAFRILHRRFPNSPWTKKTPYYY